LTSLFPAVETSPSLPYTLALHDALPIYPALVGLAGGLLVHVDQHLVVHGLQAGEDALAVGGLHERGRLLVRVLRSEERVPLEVIDRKSTRLNSSHQIISYAVFCLKKKNN